MLGVGNRNLKKQKQKHSSYEEILKHKRRKKYIYMQEADEKDSWRLTP